MLIETGRSGVACASLSLWACFEIGITPSAARGNRALREAGRAEQAIAASLALIALTPSDPLAHTALSISLKEAGQIPEAEAAAVRARVLEWKMQLASPPGQDEGKDLAR